MAEPTPPAWLIAAIDQRMALMSAHLPPGKPPEGALVITPLTEPPEDADEKQWQIWERTCDRCGRYVPDTEDFYTGSYRFDHARGFPVLVMYSVCSEHRYA